MEKRNQPLSLKAKKTLQQISSRLSSKKFMRKIVLLIVLALPFSARAQELNCAVSINATKIQTSDAGIFKDMENAIEQFMYVRKWTNDANKTHDKIVCNFLITISTLTSHSKLF